MKLGRQNGVPFENRKFNPKQIE